ncbi:radical SAM protein [Candidatus Woesearchaeota archaeon]|nr:radical SAM protein [Candidatus Woesearchaeota archaeon]
MRGKQTVDSFDVLYIELTGNCNLNCVHCGNEEENSKHLGFSHLERLLEEFNAGHGKKLVLTGGEPLLHPNIREILDVATSHNYNTKLSTNASLLNHPRFAFVLDYDLGFRVSLDGTSEVHNKIRRNFQAYDSLIAAMEKISERERQIVIRTTVMKPNVDSVVDMLFELGRLTKENRLKIYSDNIWPMRNIGKADAALMLSATEYQKFLKDLNQRTRNFHPSFKIIVGPTFGFESEFEGGPIQSNQIYKCDIINASLHIAHNGDIYPCSFIHHPLGNIAETSLSEVFRSEKSVQFRKIFLDRSNHDCDDCTVYEACQAGCIAERYRELFKPNRQPIKDAYCFREGSCE